MLTTALLRCWILFAFLSSIFTAPVVAQSGEPRAVTKTEVDLLVKELSNWGRWGSEDQLGALNLITTEKRAEAAILVRKGVSVSLARNVEKRKAPDNPSPFDHTMLGTGEKEGARWAVDHLAVSYHGYAHTHLDSLCHLFHDGKMYNGFSQKEVTQTGAKKLSIHNAKTGIFTRAVLMDLPRLKGVDFLAPGTPIYPKDLSDWLEKVGTTIRSGDVVLIYTGRWKKRDQDGPWGVDDAGVAGLHVSCAKWLKERDIAVLGTDGAADVMPSRIPGYSHPVHLLMLHAMGVHILDNLELERLSSEAHRLQRWDFLLTVAPLPVEGGTGSPVNPIATF